jgi:hypothetical protein
MEVRVKRRWCSSDINTRQLSHHVSMCLDECEHGTGQLEDMAREIDKLQDFVGELCQLLVERRALALDELEGILPYHSDEIVKD